MTGCVVGDRVLGFRFDDAGPPNDVKWRQKTWFASLQHSPALASLRCRYDAASRRLWISLPNTSGVIKGSIDEPGDRLRIEQKVNQWYATLDATPSAMGRRKAAPTPSRRRHRWPFPRHVRGADHPSLA